MGSGLEFIRQSIFNSEFDYLYSSMVILCSQLTVVTHTMKNRSTYSCYQHILKTIFYITYIIDKKLFLKYQIVKEIGQDLSEFKCGLAHLFCE